MTATQQADSKAARNAHYGKLNDRFDVRAAWLRALGFRYEHVPAMGFAVFTLTRFGKVKAVPAALVMNADDIVWGDYSEEYQRFAS